MAGPNLLQTGIYTATEAAALLGVPSQKIRAWVQGWPARDAPPMLDNDLGYVDGRLAFSFANLMELRFIAFFSANDVSVRQIRAVMNEVRIAINRPHPFATNIVFKTDGSKIVAEIIRKNGATHLYDLRTRNYEIGGVVYKSLKDGVVYDPQGDAIAWFPRRKMAPNVIIHPKLAFGRPVMRGSGIPTEAIAGAAEAEGSVESAALLFDISKKRVEEAVAFEAMLRRAA